MSTGLKKLLTLICIFFVLPGIILSRLEQLFSKKGESIHQFFAEALALLPGIPGSYLRKAYYIGTLTKCAWICRIGMGTCFPHRAVVIGERVSIGNYGIIGCADLGDDVLIASRVSIPSGRYQHRDAEGNVTPEPVFTTVKIGARTWIGEGAIVMANVGCDSVIGAGSLVTTAVPDNVTAVGNPARFIPR